MKFLCLLVACTSLAGCGTRPPLPPECEGPLTAINSQAGAAIGAIHESRAGL